MNQSIVPNPFGAPAADAMQEGAASRETAEVQAAMVIAKKFPRDAVKTAEGILNACTRASLAEGALYSYARGGSAISGPSIRLAEVIAQHWGNFQFGVRELDRNAGVSTVEAYAWDVESNTRCVKVFQVSHMRNTKRGSWHLEDERDIYELIANQGARRQRACILANVPGDLIEMAVKQCDATLNASAEGIKKMLEAFKPFGISKEQIEKRIQCRMDAIRPAQVVQLKKIWASLRDGMSRGSDWFDAAPEAARENTSLREKVAKAAARDKDAPVQSQAMQEQPP